MVTFCNKYNILTFVVLVPSANVLMGNFFSEGDSVAGICYVGTRNMTFNVVFVLAPLILYLILGKKKRIQWFWQCIFKPELYPIFIFNYKLYLLLENHAPYQCKPFLDPLFLVL
jgi:Frizzled/Smoothened family membrane region